MQIPSPVSTVQVVKSFLYGFGACVGVVVFLYAILQRFGLSVIAAKVKKYDDCCSDVETLKLQVGIISTRCDERYGKQPYN